jgi:putative DNA primase/helicase
MNDNGSDPKVKAVVRDYLGLDADRRRQVQEGILHPEQFQQETEQPPGTWADVEGLLGPITWAWKPWLPIGMLTILAGESGAGKSALALRLAGCFLRGDPWPDKTAYKGETGLILWCEAEAAQAVNLDRAKKWGLPLDQILTPTDPLEDVKLDNPDHFNSIYAAAFRPDVRLIVVDSLRGANSRDENSSDTMGMVQKVAGLARDSGKPILLTHHLRKKSIFDTDSVELERLRGSSAIVQTARLVWALDVPDPTAKNWKRLQVVKSNLAKFPEPVGMTIDDQGVKFGLAPEVPKTDSVADRAVDLLMALLQDEPQSAKAIEDEFDQAGISIATMKRAKSKLGVISIKDKDGWKWSLPARGEYEN